MQRPSYSRSADVHPVAAALDPADTLPSMGRIGDAVQAYDRMAPIYDEFNAGNDYEHWLGEVLLPELEKHRVRALPGGRPRVRALDVGCGTGRAFEPLLKRDWEVTGCDVSAEMLNQAHLNLPSGVSLWECDARALPQFPVHFDLVLALNDVVNYLTEDGDLERAFAGMKKNLAPHGLICFDANTLGLYQGSWVARRDPEAPNSSAPLEDRGWSWRGLTTDPVPEGIFEAEVAGDGIEGASVHRERHWTPAQIEGALASCGLQTLALYGQRETDRILLEQPLNEAIHYKAIYICGHAE